MSHEKQTGTCKIIQFSLAGFGISPEVPVAKEFGLDTGRCFDLLRRQLTEFCQVEGVYKPYQQTYEINGRVRCLLTGLFADLRESHQRTIVRVPEVILAVGFTQGGYLASPWIFLERDLTGECNTRKINWKKILSVSRDLIGNPWEPYVGKTGSLSDLGDHGYADCFEKRIAGFVDRFGPIEMNQAQETLEQWKHLGALRPIHITEANQFLRKFGVIQD